MISRRHLMLWSCAVAGPRPARAALESPRGPVVLTVSGQVGQPNHEAQARFDMGMLERMPQVSLTPPTPWYPQPRTFTGPLLRSVLAAAGAQGKRLRAVALNDYAVEIPFDDAQRHEVVLARLMDDKPMSVREKGPLFIMYPFDREPSLRSAVYYSRCAWQLKSIEVS